VRVHPETGRRSLFVNPGFTTHVEDVSEGESRALLGVFFAAIGRPERSVRHRWRPGDVVVWDNRSTTHLVPRRVRRLPRSRRASRRTPRPGRG
jgi:taurine dioxygenase